MKPPAEIARDLLTLPVLACRLDGTLLPANDPILQEDELTDSLFTLSLPYFFSSLLVD